MDLSKLEQQALNTLLKNELKYSKQIQQALLDALTSIYGEMTKIYDKWAVNGILSKVEMTKYNKYQTMEEQILKKLDPALKANIETIKKLLPDQFQQSFFQTAWALDNGTGLRLSYGLVNLKSLLLPFDITNPKNIELQNALKNYTINGKKAIRSALLNNLSQGKSFSHMVKDLKKAVDITSNDAIRVIRTEGMRAINSGTNYAYLQAEDMGIEGSQVWTCTKDQKTRDTHREMDGAVRVQDDSQDGWILPDGSFTEGPGDNYAAYPGDPQLPPEEVCNCRCTLRYEVTGYSPQLMRTRAEGVIPYQNYNDYAEEYHPDWLE
jgi:SPP1 gp7 family putative phage head morphogenesis protein